MAEYVSRPPEGASKDEPIELPPLPDNLATTEDIQRVEESVSQQMSTVASIESLQTVENNLSQRITENSDELRQLETDLSEQITGTNNTLNQVSQKVNNTTNQLTTTNQTVANHTTQLTNATKSISDTDKRVTNVSNQLSTTDKLVKNLSFIHQPKTGLVAHRGSHINAPENTVKSIYLAGKYGYEMVEIDVQRTSDGFYVLMHDTTLDRTTNGTGNLNAKTYASLKSLIIDEVYPGQDEDEVIRIPTLEEACKECQKWGLGVNIDTSKFTWSETHLNEVIAILRKYGLLEKSFFVANTSNLRTLLGSRPEVAFTWLTADTDPTANINTCKQYRNAFVTYDNTVITDSLIDAYKREGIPVFVHSANSWGDVYKYFTKGVRFVETDTILPGGIA